MKKLILWDLDNTLIRTNDLYFEQFVNENSLRELSRKKLKIEFDKLTIDQTLVIGEWVTKSGLLEYVVPSEDSIEVLEELSDYTRQRCLTARPFRHSTVIQRIIDKNFAPFIEDVHYFDSFGSKVEYAYKKLGASLLTDDTLRSFDGIEKTNNLGILFDERNKYRYTKIDSNLIRISNLSDVIKIVYSNL